MYVLLVSHETGRTGSTDLVTEEVDLLESFILNVVQRESLVPS